MGSRKVENSLQTEAAKITSVDSFSKSNVEKVEKLTCAIKEMKKQLAPFTKQLIKLPRTGIDCGQQPRYYEKKSANRPTGTCTQSCKKLEGSIMNCTTKRWLPELASSTCQVKCTILTRRCMSNKHFKKLLMSCPYWAWHGSPRNRSGRGNHW